MRTQRHPHNSIWLLLIVWLSVALASYAFAYPATTNALNSLKQDTLCVYTENDDIALEELRELQEKAEAAVFRLSNILLLLHGPADEMLIAFAVFSGFVPLRIFRYIRRRTRTPSFPLLHRQLS